MFAELVRMNKLGVGELASILTSTVMELKTNLDAFDKWNPTMDGKSIHKVYDEVIEYMNDVKSELLIIRTKFQAIDNFVSTERIIQAKEEIGQRIMNKVHRDANPVACNDLTDIQPGKAESIMVNPNISFDIIDHENGIEIFKVDASFEPINSLNEYSIRRMMDYYLTEYYPAIIDQYADVFHRIIHSCILPLIDRMISLYDKKKEILDDMMVRYISESDSIVIKMREIIIQNIRNSYTNTFDQVYEPIQVLYQYCNAVMTNCEIIEKAYFHYLDSANNAYSII